jgi:diacylglycerol kinase family enzyme
MRRTISAARPGKDILNPSKSPTVGLISNPSSGYNRKHFDQVVALLAKHPSIHHEVTQRVTEIAPALAKMAQHGVDVLAINGGDGTASAVLGQLLEQRPANHKPSIVLLPGGTANMNTGDLGISGKLMPALRRLIRWAEGTDRSQRDIQERCLMRVETSGVISYGMFLGAGAVIQGTEYAHREIHARGLRNDLSVAIGTVRTFWGILRNDPRFRRSVNVGLRLDGGAKQVNHQTLVLAISSLHRLFFGIRPFWGTGAGQLRLTLIENDCTRFLGTFLSILRGRPNANAVPQAGYVSHNAEQIHLTLNGSLNLDGEIIHANGAVRVNASESLRFLRL